MSPTPNRRTVLTVAGVIAAGGIATGGALAATGADAASGSGSGSSGSSGSTSSAPKAPAPGNPAYDADGTVTSVSSSSLTVRSDFGKSSTYKLSSSTKVHSGPSTSSSRSAITTGAHVHVHGSKTSSGVAATDVDIRLPHIDGSVAGLSSGTITVTDHDGFTRTIDTTSSTKYTIDGKSSTSSAVRSGRVVHASGKVDSDGTTLDATRIDVVTKAPTPPAGGPMAGGPAGGPAGPGNGKAPKAPSSKPSSGSSSKSGGSSSAPSSQPSSGSGSAS